MRSDPGWLAAQTILPQGRRRGGAPTAPLVDAFDAAQPVESQMAQVVDRGPSVEESDLAKLELEQSKYNYQRQLLMAARRRLEENGLCGGGPGGFAGGRPLGGSAEMQPLMDARHGGGWDNPLVAQQQQLDNASFELRRRTVATSASLGRERVASLVARGGGEYLELLERGTFKQVCVVCRTRKELR